MKYLAVDYGQKRVGIAVSDSGGSMAFARVTLQRTTKERFWSELLARIGDEQAQAIVVGLPLRGDGSDSLTTRQVRNFIASLKRRTPLPVYSMEETLSSFEAESLMREAALSGRKHGSALDHVAAARILESFLQLPADKRCLYE